MHLIYDELIAEASYHDLNVKEKPLQASKGRIKGKNIAVKKDIPTLKDEVTPKS